MPLLRSVVQVVLFCLIDPIARFANAYIEQPKERLSGFYIG